MQLAAFAACRSSNCLSVDLNGFQAMDKCGTVCIKGKRLDVSTYVSRLSYISILLLCAVGIFCCSATSTLKTGGAATN
jgi:hypothetical protein